MRKPTPPPFRPLFMAAIGIVIVGKIAAAVTGLDLIVWVGALVAVALGAFDIFRWLHQDATHDARNGGDSEA